MLVLRGGSLFDGWSEEEVQFYIFYFFVFFSCIFSIPRQPSSPPPPSSISTPPLIHPSPPPPFIPPHPFHSFLSPPLLHPLLHPLPTSSPPGAAALIPPLINQRSSSQKALRIRAVDDRGLASTGFLVSSGNEDEKKGVRFPDVFFLLVPYKPSSFLRPSHLGISLQTPISFPLHNSGSNPKTPSFELVREGKRVNPSNEFINRCGSGKNEGQRNRKGGI